MPRKQTSEAVSAIAGKYVRMRDATMHMLSKSPDAEHFFRDIRKLAASVLSQDETKGKRNG